MSFIAVTTTCKSEKSFTLLFLIFAICTLQAQKPERLIAFAHYYQSTGYTPFDSGSYKYSGTRNIDSIWPVHAHQAYDTFYNWHNTAGYVPFRKYIANRNGIDKLLNDTIYSWSAADGYMAGAYANYKYDQRGYPDSAIYLAYSPTLYNWRNSNYIKLTFDPAGNKLSEQYFNWSSTNSRWETSEIYLSAYTPSNQLKTYSRLDWIQLRYNGHYQITYNYNSLGQIDSAISAFVYPTNPTTYVSLAINNFNSSGDLSTQIIQKHTTAGWLDSAQRSYTYDADHNLLQYSEENIIPNGTVKYRRYDATYDTQNMITSYSYTAPDSTTADGWASGYTDQMRYYYESYHPSGLADIQLSQGEAKIYPVPAADMLSIDIKWNNAQQAKATLFDISGHAYSELSIPSGKSYHGFIATSQLPQGTYFIDIQGADGHIVKSFNIIK